MTNEFGEIRICDLVPTKAHSQFDIALTRMNHSIHLFGLDPPCVIFTDNLADKPMLEHHFLVSKKVFALSIPMVIFHFCNFPLVVFQSFVELQLKSTQ